MLRLERRDVFSDRIAAIRRSSTAPSPTCSLPGLESAHLEYKATLRTHADGGEQYVPLETAVLKSIAAFLNSRDGGTLLIGVSDDGGVHGLGTDYTTLHKPGKDDGDQFQQHLANIITASVGAAAATNVRPTIQHVDGGDVCRIQVDPLLDRAEVPAQISATVPALWDGSTSTTHVTICAGPTRVERVAVPAVVAAQISMGAIRNR